MNKEMLLECAAVLCATAAYLIVDDEDEKEPRKKRRCKTRLINRKRRRIGYFNMHFRNIKENNIVKFFKYTRMRAFQFDHILKGVTPMIKKQKCKDGICPEERLALTLHYLSQGCSMQSIASKYNMGLTTVSKIIKETCDAVYTFLSPNYLKLPSSAKEWLEISEGFMEEWNFPNCIGALDGKHVAIQAPGKSGSLVLLAACDANYVFRLVDIGSYDLNSDGSVFRKSEIGKLLDENQLNIPSPSRIPGTNFIQPYVIVANEAFPLKNYIMRPYPKKNLSNSRKIFNYRLSRARQCIENAFHIMTYRWKLLRTTIVADINNIDSFIKAIICLHNFLLSEQILFEDNMYCPQELVDEELNQDLDIWRDSQSLQSVGRLASNKASRENILNRDNLCDYFLSNVGSVPWQNKVITEDFT